MYRICVNVSTTYKKEWSEEERKELILQSFDVVVVDRSNCYLEINGKKERDLSIKEVHKYLNNALKEAERIFEETKVNIERALTTIDLVRK